MIGAVMFGHTWPAASATTGCRWAPLEVGVALDADHRRAHHPRVGHPGGQHADDLREPWPMMGPSAAAAGPGTTSGVHQALESSLPPTNPATHADQQRHHHAQGGGREPHRERHPRPVQQAAEDVAPDVVGARGRVQRVSPGSCDPARESVEEVVTVPGTSLIHAVACDQSGTPVRTARAPLQPPPSVRRPARRNHPRGRRCTGSLPRFACRSR